MGLRSSRASSKIAPNECGSTRGYQTIFVESPTLASPGYDGQPPYIYTSPHLR
jgi:hypothetical protein